MKPYSDPKISPLFPKPSDIKKEWFQFSFAQGINRIKEFKQRLAEAEILRKMIYDKLQLEGWNPVTDTYNPEVHSDIDANLKKVKLMSLNEALQFAFDKRKKEWTPKTQQDYGSMLKYFKKAGFESRLHDKGVHHFRGAHFKLLLETVETIRDLSHKGYNKYRDYLSTLVGEMVQWDIVEINYIHNIRSKKEPKTFAHIPPDEAQRQKIVDYIKTEHPNYYVFLCIIYGCTLRPKEILSLRVRDINFSRQEIRLEAKNAKTSTEGLIAMPNWLGEMLKRFLEKHPNNENDYMFTSSGSENFIPGINPPGKNLATRTWKSLVKDELRLNISQYSLKKLAGNDMIKLQQENGVMNLLELPRVQMGHTNSRQTEVYVTEHLKVINEVIKGKMPQL